MALSSASFGRRLAVMLFSYTLTFLWEPTLLNPLHRINWLHAANNPDGNFGIGGAPLSVFDLTSGLDGKPDGSTQLDEVYTLVYTEPMEKTRAKLFPNGGSQAVRLPKECRFEESEVLIHKQGRRVILEPIDEWPDEFRACLGAWPQDIPRPKQRPLADGRNPFE